MEHLSFYRKYRPSKFEDVVDQDYIVKTIENSILNNKLSHAYLFYGPRGTGKTSMAKLIAKIVNCTNLNNFDACNACDSCRSINDKSNSDIIEMDAASNNGVDEIRDIRSKVILLPNISQYRVYIIDEVHMLSVGAFNALLKTLEEPPAHVIFILATTEINKVPETIISRCQSFEFRRISNVGIAERLKLIAKEEKLDVEEAVFDLIADYSNGGLRDSINMLDKLSSFSDVVTVKDFYCFKGINNPELINEFVGNLLDLNLNKIVEMFELFRKSGINYVLLINEILLNLRNRIVKKAKENCFDNNDNLFFLVDKFSTLIVDVKNAVYSNIIFEVGVLKLFNSNSKLELNKVEKSNDVVFESINNNTNLECSKNNSEFNFDYDKLISIRVNNAFANASKKILNDYIKKWKLFENFVNDDNYSSIVSYLLDGTLRVAGDKNAIISVKYESVLKNALANLQKIEELFEKSINKCSLIYVLDSNWESLKADYINNLKNGNKYIFIEENLKDDIIDVAANGSFSDSVTVEDAIDLFGSEIVEIK